MTYPRQGDFVFLDAEPHAGHEIGGHSPSSGNVRRPFLVLSGDAYNQKTGFVYVMAISSKHRDSFFRQRIIDYASGINGDLLLTQVPQYDFSARHGEIVGHIKDKNLFDDILDIFLQIFE